MNNREGICEVPICGMCAQSLQSCLTLLRSHGQVPLYMGCFRQEYWSELPSPPPEDLSDSGIKPKFTALQADSLPTDPTGKPETDIAAAAAAKSLQ